LGKIFKLKSKKEIEIAKINKEKIKRIGEKISLFALKNPKITIEEINKIKKEILEFNAKRKTKERKIKKKRKNFIILLEIEIKIKKRGNKETKRIAKEFWVPTVLKEICFEKSNGKMNFPKS
jgi:hypothetical protein